MAQGNPEGENRIHPGVGQSLPGLLLARFGREIQMQDRGRRLQRGRDARGHVLGLGAVNGQQGDGGRHGNHLLQCRVL